MPDTQIICKKKVCIITGAYASQEGATPTILSNFVDLIEAISCNLCVITGNFPRIKTNSTKIIRVLICNGQKNVLSRISCSLVIQIKMSYELVKVQRDIDLVLFFLGSRTLFLPMITIKLLKKNIAVVYVGSLFGANYVEGKSIMKRVIFDRIPYILTELSYILCDNIIVYSKLLFSDTQLEKYLHKSIIAHRHFLDFETFTVTTSLSDRPPLIGYIGRLSEVKGVQHFVRALPAILSDRQDLRVLIGGDGQLKESIKASMQEEGIAASVDLLGWISHDDLPEYLNQLRLLVLPSYTEGLPNIMLEAMACGTPVLATPVGAVPDVIIDGKTGFIMEDNSHECIAKNVMRALDSPEREGIAEAGRRFVEENFTFERVVERWKEVLEDI